MSGPLIINARHRLAWHQRLVSDASTAMMWGGWLWLWSPILNSSSWLADLGARSFPVVNSLMLATAAGGGGFRRSLFALVGTSGTLMVWNRLPARRPRAGEALSVREYARQFQLPVHELQAGRRAAVCVVHHDASGRIVQVECREPEGRVEALAG
ncbi:poly-beta-1,6-N-acetyl-D-glucosamine biosynthesis protein PgaD [Anaeromyxobacter oryzae]|uniref:Poly-beta-1,6-N-acetyl-D-glucosamine biosynthesis protein PgaD n=1 Tax=Anaeromyxobacter oryzae TaxID=2918170 RepID=A0ABM7X177_9BACT|nr:poly-beta-1,6-N-acetyl-D-glucosamine biosynthesis protein PgaD [Anaeromyxobacter oryzae]BDG05550.1 poly-beta-1,6-N-acetyl-D-glucosamine biosynthesis protein PgaD [Anaeromyxobacter oryzae]